MNCHVDVMLKHNAAPPFSLLYRSRSSLTGLGVARPTVVAILETVAQSGADLCGGACTPDGGRGLQSTASRVGSIPMYFRHFFAQFIAPAWASACCIPSGLEQKWVDRGARLLPVVGGRHAA